MDLTTLLIIALVVVVLVIAGLAWGAYRAGFRVKKARVKTPVFEAEMERQPFDTVSPPTPSTTPTGPDIRQQATAGGAIKESGITAPADSAAKISQQAKDQDSEIDNSPIKLT
ncbi:MAG: hypothetical protein L6R45_24750 [Anaerolineae bacterium]|nr:hypothetical protein [Anaerolineae bacterium]